MVYEDLEINTYQGVHNWENLSVKSQSGYCIKILIKVRNGLKESIKLRRYYQCKKHSNL